VSRISEQWSSGRVLRLNLPRSEVNRQYAETLGATTTPTFILFDASGNEQRRWVEEAPALQELPGNDDPRTGSLLW
jgi:hypothetical protein